MSRGATATAAGALATVAGPVLLRLGLVADVQFADVDNRESFDGTATRRHRQSLDVLRDAVREFRDVDVDVAMQLGDLVDIANVGEDCSASFARVLAELAELGALKQPLRHVIGNHDLYNFKCAEVQSVLGMSAGYYSFVPRKGWRCVVVDSFHVTVLGQRATKARAEAVLDTWNPNPWRESGVDFLEGLRGPLKRYVPFNGGLGEAQLEWFARELREAHDAQEKVLIFSHAPFLPEAECPDSKYVCLAWDYPQVLAAIERSPCHVVAVFAGHDHFGGHGVQRFLRRETGERCCVHHCTLPGVVETPATGHPRRHTLVSIYSDRVEVQHRDDPEFEPSPPLVIPLLLVR